MSQVATSDLVVVTQVYPQKAVPASQSTQPSHKVDDPVQKFLRGQPRPVGTVQILIGILSISCGIIKLQTIDTLISLTKTPLWAGVLYIVSGSLCIATDRNPKMPLVKVTLIMNLVSAITSFGVMILYCVDMALLNMEQYCLVNENSSESQSAQECMWMSRTLKSSEQGISGTLLFFATLELCLAISMSVFGFKTIYYNESKYHMISHQACEDIQDPHASIINYSQDDMTDCSPSTT
ncbi:membrane-spanning 4-domains subfamily A member 4A-like [Erpetoichthys calabaricus]|uniref:Membrane-spanning 4-domains subfamily A member 4A-like n=1 Tax=Erpetoichthys calabaricus TaxID=27687 RepID=A0A8C4RIF1_ERPCA|nr:membrane-spanning 4-domains subfamily A member 4A-like [Erpetoichthys calabaricus]